jgi:hypothetical protein
MTALRGGPTTRDDKDDTSRTVICRQVCEAMSAFVASSVATRVPHITSTQSGTVAGFFLRCAMHASRPSRRQNQSHNYTRFNLRHTQRGAKCFDSEAACLRSIASIDNAQSASNMILFYGPQNTSHRDHLCSLLSLSRNTARICNEKSTASITSLHAKHLQSAQTICVPKLLHGICE